MLPREHGAYAQLLVPLLTILIISGSGLTLSSWLLTLGVVGAFLVHEPLVVLLGWRGTRARRESGDRAQTQAMVLGLFAGLSLVGGLVLAPSAAIWALLALTIPTAFLGILIRQRREKTIGGEILVGSILAFAAVPIGLAGGVELAQTLATALVWCAVTVLGTLSVHAIVARSRKGLRWPGRAVTTLALATAAIGVLALWDTTPIVSLALLPTALAVALVSTLVTSAKHLKRVGWSMVAAFLMTALCLVLIVG